MFLSLGIAAGHAALIVFGRLNFRHDLQQLTLNPYYVYISLLFLLIGGAVPLLGLDRLRLRAMGKERDTFHPNNGTAPIAAE